MRDMRDILKGAALGVMGCSIWLTPDVWQVLSPIQRDIVGGGCCALICAAIGVLGTMASWRAL